MLEYYWFSKVLEVVDKIPREVTIGVFAYAIYHRYSEIRMAEATAQVKVEALKVEALKLQKELQTKTKNKPASEPVES